MFLVKRKLDGRENARNRIKSTSIPSIACQLNLGERWRMDVAWNIKAGGQDKKEGAFVQVEGTW